MSIKSREKQKLKQAEENALLLTRDGYSPTQEEVKSLGMVFTPPELVNQMIDKLPSQDFSKKDETYLDNSCGTGNFLIELLRRRMATGLSHSDALATIYGVDINKQILDICKKRLALGSTEEIIWFILNHNIICANALDEKHRGWREYGYMWTPKTKRQKKNEITYKWKLQEMLKGSRFSDLIVFDAEDPISQINVIDDIAAASLLNKRFMVLDIGNGGKDNFVCDLNDKAVVIPTELPVVAIETECMSLIKIDPMPVMVIK